MAHRFFNTFVNWIKYVDQESSDGERASVKTTGDKEISDWEVLFLEGFFEFFIIFKGILFN